MAPLRRRRQRDYSCMQPLKDREPAAGLGPAGASGSVPYPWLPYPDEVEVEEGAEEEGEEEREGSAKLPTEAARKRGRERKEDMGGDKRRPNRRPILIERVRIFRFFKNEVVFDREGSRMSRFLDAKFLVLVPFIRCLKCDFRGSIHLRTSFYSLVFISRVKEFISTPKSHLVVTVPRLFFGAVWF